MRHRHGHGCGHRGRIEFSVPEALFAMRGGRGGQWGPFNFEFDESGFGGGRRGGRGRRRVFESGELRLVLLKLVADEPRHGYDLIRAVEELTGGEYAPSPGVIYPTLTLLQDMGLIEEAPGDGPRKPFQVTDEGRAHLEEKAEEIDGLFERLEDLKPREAHGDRASIGRATSNLMAAIRNRVSRLGWDDELTHEITSILDDAAQRIERLK